MSKECLSGQAVIHFSIKFFTQPYMYNVSMYNNSYSKDILCTTQKVCTWEVIFIPIITRLKNTFFVESMYNLFNVQSFLLVKTMLYNECWVEFHVRLNQNSKNVWRHGHTVVRSVATARFKINLSHLQEGRVVEPQVHAVVSTVPARPAGRTALHRLGLDRTLGRGWALDWGSGGCERGWGHAKVAGFNGGGCGLSVVQWIPTARCRFLRVRGWSEKGGRLVLLMVAKFWLTITTLTSR